MLQAQLQGTGLGEFLSSMQNLFMQVLLTSEYSYICLRLCGYVQKPIKTVIHTCTVYKNCAACSYISNKSYLLTQLYDYLSLFFFSHLSFFSQTSFLSCLRNSSMHISEPYCLVAHMLLLTFHLLYFRQLLGRPRM